MNHIIKQAPISQELIQVATLRFPSNDDDDDNADAPPSSFAPVCQKLHAIPGVVSSYLGRQLEHHDTWTWIIRWASPAAHDAYLASPSFTSWLVSLRAVVQSYIFWKALVRGSLSAALNAPCTEVFTAYGASDDFLEFRMKPFVDNVDAACLPGHHGSFYGQYDVQMHHLPADRPVGNTVSVIMGWDSKEAHQAQRGEGKVIDAHIHHVRQDRKSTDMYHVKLRKLLFE